MVDNVLNNKNYLRILFFRFSAISKDFLVRSNRIDIATPLICPVIYEVASKIRSFSLKKMSHLIQ